MSAQFSWPGHLPRHSLDLLETFSDHADNLRKAAVSGGRAHRAGNIAESGTPFEAYFRRLLGSSLPGSVSVYPGYFFDAEWNLSPQQDLMVCNLSELVQFPPAQDLTQRYVPWGCLHAVGQLKNTGTPKQVLKALHQCADAIETYGAMRAAGIASFLLRTAPMPPPMSVVAFARGSRKAIDTVLATFTRPVPDYIFLLQEGIIYSKRPNKVMDLDDSTVMFRDRTQGGPLFPCGPEVLPAGKHPGAALLWFVFAFLARLSDDYGQPGVSHLIEQVQRQHRLVEL